MMPEVENLAKKTRNYDIAMQRNHKRKSERKTQKAKVKNRPAARRLLLGRYRTPGL
jgi:hypothetical protein